jgi:CRISPR system Cascade subunit CasD
MSVLLIRLAGPMQAWGTQSRFSIRDTGLDPSKSGVVGLLCAALGKPRHEEPGDDFPALADLTALRMAVRVDRPGTMLPDYHTAQNVVIASSVPGRKPKLKDCEPSVRYYLADADFLVALEGPDTSLLDRLHHALAEPVWPLFLGRKAFVPSMPLYVPDGRRDDLDAVAALKDHPWWKRVSDTPWRSDEPDDRLRISYEVDAVDGETRNDVPLSFLSRQRAFTTRRVRDEFWDIKQQAPHLIQEWPSCTSVSSS